MISKMACWRILAALLLAVISQAASSKDRLDTLVVNRIFNYRSSIDSTIEGYQTQAYLKYRVKTNRRNAMLLCVPHLYTVARSNQKSHLGESYLTLTFHESEPTESEVHVRTSTIHRHRTVLPDLYGYLTPNIYQTTLLSDHLYSPFHTRNKRYYKYTLKQVFGTNANVEFRPRVKNTQAVRGNAIVDIETGRIIRCTLLGEFDMVSFEINLTMGAEGLASLLPTTCILKTKFSFMGNNLRGIYEAQYGIAPLADKALVEGIQAREQMDSLRPTPLTTEERDIYAEYDSLRRSKNNADTTTVREKNFIKNFLWDVIGDHLLNRIKGKFDNDRGYYRISPIINPLYLSYSHRKGLTYRLTARAGYVFNDNSNLYVRAKIGYSVKLNHTYFDIPLTYTFDDRNNGKVRLLWRNDELQASSTVLDQLKEKHGNTFDWDTLSLDYFKHSRLALTAQYDLNPYVGVETGILFSQWRSIDKQDFRAMGKPTLYKSTALCEELTIRPLGWGGPIVTIDYERTLNGVTRDDMDYERWEFDCSYLKPLPCLRSLSLRAGFGFYTTGTKNTYFLDFNNFREDNIPGGWNDEWSGDFELLHRNWYNSSHYYIRANAAYESPLLLLSWIPMIGTITENERIYVSALHLSQIKYYMEVGYGFTNRLLSMGIFTGYEEFKHFSLGLRFDFRLFDRW